MKKCCIAFLVLVIFGCGGSIDLNGAQTDAASSWIALVDSEQYSESWNRSSSVFQSGVTESDWIEKVQQVRSVLGDVSARVVSDAKSKNDPLGAPTGSYVVIQYDASFAKRADVIETLSLFLEKDGSWRVSGYFIK